jgi:predicted PurR-regulated permease PerM
LIGLGLKLTGVPYASVLSFAVLVFGILQVGSVVVLLPVIIWIWSAKDLRLLCRSRSFSYWPVFPTMCSSRC